MGIMQDYYNSLAWATIILLILALGLLVSSAFKVKSKSSNLMQCSVEIKDKTHWLTMAVLLLALVTTWSLKELTGNPLQKVSSASYAYYSCLNTSPNMDNCESKDNYLQARISEAEMHTIEPSKVTAAVNSGKYDALSNYKNSKTSVTPKQSKPLENKSNVN